jgi:uncharacterized protein YbjT (DUF2867 family)
VLPGHSAFELARLSQALANRRCFFAAGRHGNPKVLHAFNTRVWKQSGHTGDAGEMERREVKVLMFGATGMVGQGVLRECLRDAGVEAILSVVRGSTGQSNPKLRELVVPNLFDTAAFEADLKGFDACFFCLGISSAGMTEADYRRVTFDLTLGVGRTLARLNPGMTFIYVSGSGTDTSEHGRSMWARVKGETENALLRLPFKAVMFRPAGIIPLHGIRSRTPMYRVIYSLTRPLWKPLRAVFPQFVTTTEQVGRAMLRVAREGAPKQILESRDIDAL